MECHPLSGPHMMWVGRRKDYKYGVVDTKQMCCMSTLRGTSILQLQPAYLSQNGDTERTRTDSWAVKTASSRKKTNLKKEKYTHLLGDQETSASQTVTRGLTVSLGKTTKMASSRLHKIWHQQQLVRTGACTARRSSWN